MGLGTAFANKYRYDQYFRTGVNIIALQVFFAVLILLFVAIAFNYLYRDISLTLIQEITESIAAKETADGTEIIAQLQEVRTENLTMVASVLVLATIVMGYILARITLAPTRNALQGQKQFISNIAHELRTPLAIIKTNTEVSLLDQTIDRELQKTMVSNIEELDRISEIIHNLLTFTSYTRPDSMEFKDVDLGEVVDTVAGKLAPMATRKRIEVTVHKNEYRTVWGNATALEQVVMNLLKNAISYTPDHGRISISIEPNYRGFIELSVKDSGMGIARKDLYRIFEPFYRADRSRNRHTGGSGLGLAIVQELIKLHNGTIQALSAPGRGTVMVALIPCGKRPTEKPALTEDDRFEGYDEVTVDFSNRPRRSQQNRG